MRRSKHFRKDVLIVRGAVCAICIGILILVTSTINVILENTQESETESFVSGSIITEKEQKDWYKVLYEGKQGFVSAQYVKKVSINVSD